MKRRVIFLKKTALQIAALAAALLLICLVIRFATGNTYTAYIPLYGDGNWRLESRDGEIARFSEPRFIQGYARVEIRPMRSGEAEMIFSDGENEAFGLFRVGRTMIVYDRITGGFTGDSVVLVCVTVFFLAVSWIMLHGFVSAHGPERCSYTVIYYAGFSVFSLSTGVLMGIITVNHLMDPVMYPMISAYSVLNCAGMQFMQLTMPLVLAFALAMAVSNLVLLRHARTRLQNLLGLLVSLILVAGEAFGFWLFNRDFMGSEWEYRVTSTLEGVYATVFVYFECMLLGAVVSALRVVRREPSGERDCIIILGCYFNRDGTLPPLLRGRADRALAFWRRQKAETGREAFFVPSGGQGPDEPMPEGEAIRRYLCSQGIPNELILVEDKARNTYENMAFSRRLIEERMPGARVLYATTNYHVFRSGVWAAQAGLRAEGVGGRTRWWYWPNAFMRECVGLLVRRWKAELLLLIVLILFFGTLSMILR